METTEALISSYRSLRTEFHSSTDPSQSANRAATEAVAQALYRRYDNDTVAADFLEGEMIEL